MSRQIFVNLPVKNLSQSVEFFTRLGFAFNLQLTNGNAACLIVSDNSFVMLLTEAMFQSFTPKTLCDATQSSEVLVALSSGSREAVDDRVRKAVAAGGTLYNGPQDHGFMYGHGFQDLDGHIWEFFYMEPGTACQA